MPADLLPFDLTEHLTNPEDQAELIEDAFASGDISIIRNALNLVARAKGMTQVARDAGVTREALYRSLSADGDPRMSTLFGVVKSLGITLRATVDKTGPEGVSGTLPSGIAAISHPGNKVVYVGKAAGVYSYTSDEFTNRLYALAGARGIAPDERTLDMVREVRKELGEKVLGDHTEGRVRP